MIQSRTRYLFALLLLSFGWAAVGHAIPLRARIDLSTAVAQQSAEEYVNYPASLAIDGNLNNFTHTAELAPDPRLWVTLPAAEKISTVVIYNRTSCCADRLQNLTVLVYADTPDDPAPLYTSDVINPGNALGSPSSITVEIPGDLSARTVMIRREAGTGPAPGVLSIGELVLLKNSPDAQLPLDTDLAHAGITTLTASQSSTHGSFGAGNALDGNLSNFTHSASFDAAATWEADFGEEVRIQRVVLHNRSDCCADRLQNITVTVLDAGQLPVWTSPVLNPNNELVNPGILTADIEGAVGTPVRGRYVRVTRAGIGGDSFEGNVLSLGEVDIFGGTVTSAPGTPPALSVGFAAGQFTVSWPAGAAGYELQSTTSLAVGPWTTVPGIVNNTYSVAVTPATPVRFFRLAVPLTE